MSQKILTAEELYHNLINEYKIVGETGGIKFTLKNLTIDIETKDTVGNLLQEWISAWMDSQNIYHGAPDNTQNFPDFYLNPKSKESNLLEIKSFDYDRGPGFDIANFDAYCNSLKDHAYRIDSNYLLIAYLMEKSKITIKQIWLKKVWEITGGSGPYPVKVQEKKNIIYNIRPIIWYSDRNTYKPFSSKEEFLKELSETRYKYPPTHSANAHWLDIVLKNYKKHTGIVLKMP